MLAPLMFLPRGKVFEGALEVAPKRSEFTPELRGALRDTAVRAAHVAEMVEVLVVVLLMFVKPF
jgi:hypothetical protein